MATNIELNEPLLTRAMKLGGMRTKKAAVNGKRSTETLCVVGAG
jgi:Arc/MetJ family transcription regulator